MAKGKDDKKYTPAQIMALKSSIGPRATMAFTQPGKKATGLAKPDRSKGPRIEVKQPDQKVFNALNAAGRFAAESVALGAAGKAAKTAYKGTYALGKKVVHGSPVRGLKSITPRTGSAALPESRVNYSWNPSAFKGDKGRITQYASEYTGSQGTGSYYVGKVKRGDIVKPAGKRGPISDAAIVSKGPIKVTKEIPRVDGYLKDMDAVSKAFPSSRMSAKAKDKLVKQLGKKDKALKNTKGNIA